MGVELLMGYVVSAALFYVLMAKTAPVIEEESWMAKSIGPGEIIELFPQAQNEERRVA